MPGRATCASGRLPTYPAQLGMASAQGTSLKTYVLTRLALVFPMVFILLTMVFLLMRVAPGDPISASLGGHAPPAVVQEIKHRLGYDKPLLTQYGEYLWQTAQGDFGTTITDRREVTDIIRVNGAATLELTIAAMMVAIFVGIPLGLIAGRFRDTSLDATTRLFGIVIYAMPVFFLGFLAQLFFGPVLGILPTSDQASPLTEALLDTPTNIFLVDAAITGNWSAFWDVSTHLILPAVTLGLVTAGIFIRLVRVNVIRTLKDDYIEAARARGIPERSVVYRHAFRNALVPVITVVGLQMALLLSGAVLTEATFNWPGIGNELITYLQNRDYAAVQGIIVVFALIVVAVSLLIDLVSAAIDPRIRY
jgi:peptide/nickel transport system permease protein